jgi:putative transposase
MEPVPPSLPFCNRSHAASSRRDRHKGHAILILDQVGWHGSKELQDSEQLLTPATANTRSRPQQPRKRLAEFMRDSWLSNRVFKSYDDLVDHCCAAWNKLVDQPWRIMSLGLRQWAHRF